MCFLAVGALASNKEFKHKNRLEWTGIPQKPVKPRGSYATSVTR